MQKFLVLGFFFFSSLAYAQDSDQIIHTDLDGDGKPDTVQLQNYRLHIKLSSQKQPIIEPESEGENDPPSLRVARVGFIESFDGMRYGSSYHFAYDKASRQIQVIGMDQYSLGNAANDGSGKDSVNLQTGDYVGKWHYYDHKNEKLRAYPTINTRLKIKPIYLNDTNFNHKLNDIWYQIDQLKTERGIDN